jgi:hypothetical protein
MTCHDAREWLSDLLDDALEAETRTRVDAHLAGCADCRRELDRLRATVSLLRAVERPQAPAGFVDRVLEAARPAPWYRRLLDWLAAVRLLRFPVEAAAVVLVASLAVYVFQETPALRRAAQPEVPQDHTADRSVSTEAPTAGPLVAPVSRPDTGREQTQGSTQVRSKSLPPVPPTAPPTVPPAASPAAPEPSGEPQRMKAAATAEELAAVNSARVSSDPALRELRSPVPAAPSGPQDATPTPGAVFSPADRSGPPEGRLQSLRKDDASGAGGAAERPVSQSPPVALGPSPEPRDRIAREKVQERTERSAPGLTPASRPPAPSAMRIAASVPVVGRLTVKDRQRAERELAELLARVGGAETARGAEAGGATVDLVVPRAAYPAFTQGLARIGSWRPEAEPPELPDSVPITLRITQ